MKLLFAVIASLLVAAAVANTSNSFCSSKGSSSSCSRVVRVHNADVAGIAGLTGYIAVVTSQHKTGKGTFVYTRKWIDVTIVPHPRVTIRHTKGTYDLNDNNASTATSVTFNATTTSVGMHALFLWNDLNSNGALDAGEQNLTLHFYNSSRVQVIWNPAQYSNFSDENSTHVHQIYKSGTIYLWANKTATWDQVGTIGFNFSIPDDYHWKNGVLVFPGACKIDKTFTPNANLTAKYPTYKLGTIVSLRSSSDSGTANVNKKSIKVESGSTTVVPNVDLTFTDGSSGILNYEDTVIPYLNGVAQTAQAVSVLDISDTNVTVNFDVTIGTPLGGALIDFQGAVNKKIFAFGFNAALSTFDSLLWDPQTGYSDPNTNAASHFMISFGTIAAVFFALAVVKRM